MTDLTRRIESLSPQRRELLKQLLAKDQAHKAATSQAHDQVPEVTPDPAHRYDPFPLTDVQEAYWIGRNEDFEMGNVAAHGYMEFESVGADLVRFRRAWQQLIERHDMLRMIVLPDGRQQILEHVPPFELPVLDLRGEFAETVAARLEAVRAEMSHQVLPADRWPLFDIRATLLDGSLTRIHFSMDLLVADAGSFWIFIQELGQLYTNPAVSLPPLELSFRDYVLAEAAQQDSEAYRRARDYWLARIPELRPAPELPLVMAPGGLANPRFVRRTDRLVPDAWRRLKELGTRLGLTPSAVLLAAFSEVLATWSKSQRFTLNLTLFNRLPVHPQVNQIVGDFTSLIMLAVENGQHEAFKDKVVRIQKQLWSDLEHRAFGGIRVLRELRKVEPSTVMPVVFTSMLGLGVSTQATSVLGKQVYGISQTPQVWLDHQVSEVEDGTLILNYDVVEELFPAGLLDDMFEAYLRLLRRLAEDETAWENPVALLPEWQLAERAAANDTTAPLPPGLLHDGFLAQAAARPAAPAVIWQDGQLTYGETAGLARQIGRQLRELGVRPNELVGVLMEKGWEQIVGVLGVLLSGGAYLPIDAGLPQERQHYLLNHGQVRVALTQPGLAERLAWPAGLQVLTIDRTGWQAGIPEPPLPPVQRPEDLAYVIFTSGSTGLPKGVMIDHRGALNTCVDINRRFGVTAADRVLGLSALNFDLSVYDIFGLLAAGGAVVLPDPAGLRDPAHWLDLLVGAGVTLWDTVPALMEMLVEYAAGRGACLPDSLRLVLMSGDWIPVTLPERIRKLASPDIAIISLGGATEASIWSILYPIGAVETGWQSIPYGRPMVNQRFHVLNERREPCPVWTPGTLYIGGVGLAQGYWRDAAKTAASFITHPRSGERLYRTGDLGRYLPGGLIEFLGREDFQVKVRGHRIELGEIETALEAHPQVRAAVVTAVGELRGDKHLVAYIVPAEGAGLAAGDLKVYLKTRLPEYMVPPVITFLDALPLTANGKVDRQALPAPEMTQPAAPPTDSRPLSALAVEIASVVESVLLRAVERDTNLLDTGASSVDLIRIATLLEKRFGFRPKMSEFFSMQTLGGIAAYYEQRMHQAAAAPPTPTGGDWEEGEL